MILEKPCKMLSCKYLVREKSGEVSKYFLTLFYGIVVVEITMSLASGGTTHRPRTYSLQGSVVPAARRAAAPG